MSSPASGGSSRTAIESFFGQINYNYKGTYFLSGTLRADGSSRFLNNKWGTFGSLGLAWIVSNEGFLKNNRYLNYLKLKASAGTLGHQSGISAYSGDNIYSMRNMGDKFSLLFGNPGNPDLTWERSNMFQMGAEMTLFKQLNLSLEVYDKHTSALIYTRRVAPSNGYALFDINDARIENYGMDIDLTWNAIKSKDYHFTVRANAGFVANRMRQMPIDPTSGKPKYLDPYGAYGRTKDRSLYEFYIREYAGVNPETGKSLWTIHFEDNDNDGKFDPKKDKEITSLSQYEHEESTKAANDPNYQKKNVVVSTTDDYSKATKKFIGKSALPIAKGGVTFNGGYKGLELSVQFVYSLGGYGYDNIYASLMGNEKIGTGALHIDQRNRWTPTNKDSDIPRLNNGKDLNANSRSSRFLTSNSFLHLANVRLGYEIPKSWLKHIHLTSASVWVSGDNLMLLSARKGYNPSTALTGSSSAMSYTPLSTFTGGIRVSL